MAGKNFSPRTWIRYWYGGVALGLVILIVGIAGGDALLIFLGVAILVFAPAMIAFWRRADAQNQPPDSN
jgi:hypothetical protein